MRLTLRTVLFLTLFMGTLGLAKSAQCEQVQWKTPDQYIRACYSDIPALFGERGLDKGQWAYSSGMKSVEYPVVTGAVMWGIAKITPSGIHAVRSYFNINVFLLLIIFIFIALVTFKIRPEFSYLLPLAPAAVMSLYINWDLWAIISMMGAIYWFDRKKYLLSALALGISISTKFMPIFLLLPILFIFWKKNYLRESLKYLGTTLLTFAVINIPVYLSTPQGWLRFYQLNISRGPDWGSPWYALSLLGIDVANLNYLAILSLLIGLILIFIFLLELSYIPTLASVSFILMATAMAVSKVYSPQYVLWLTPLAAIALIDKRDLPAFWIWQGGEVLYHLAIWEHLALVTGAKFGLPPFAFAIATLIRIVASLYLVAILVRRSLKVGNRGSRWHKSLRQFRFDSPESYP